ncbi:MAG: hypothetical protein H6P96_221 [Candidatus Aminicenantes bacterium]|nr:hypothetical protein [Candidatus Aminicenantes bacterium]
MTCLSRVRCWLAAGAVSLAIIGVSPALPGPQEPSDQARLATILEKAAHYCWRLDRAALDFVCLEEVSEMKDRHLRHFDVFLYDYQFVRKKDEIKEQRNLIAIDGRKASRQSPPIQPAAFRYKNVLFGPVGLLSESWQAYHSYRIVGEEKILDEKAVVVEATPLPKAHEPHPYGRIWIKESDGSVLKIAWDQASLGNFGEIEEWAAENESQPRITAYCEYRFEKNGLRFPSRNFTQQAYIRKDRSIFVNAEISVVYKNYKFFTVETAVAY